VTVIEVGLIVMIMISGGSQTSTLARDKVFAAVMIVCSGRRAVAARGGTTAFNPEGTALLW
jgi:Ca2+:H+ antiporter